MTTLRVSKADHLVDLSLYTDDACCKIGLPLYTLVIAYDYDDVEAVIALILPAARC